MNWSRGSLRLWIAISLFWQAGIITMALMHPPVSYQERNRPPRASEINACKVKTSGPWCNDALIEDQAVFEKTTVIYYVVAAFGMPAILLAIGLGTRWVAAGFRKSG